jgi:hypothetical protein
VVRALVEAVAPGFFSKLQYRLVNPDDQGSVNALTTGTMSLNMPTRRLLQSGKNLSLAV